MALNRNMHDRVIILRKQHLPILESLRRSLWRRQNARHGFKNISKVDMVSVDAHFSPRQDFQAAKRAHDGEPLLVHDRPRLLRATKGTTQQPKCLMIRFFTSTPPSSPAVGTCLRKLPQWLSEASGKISTTYASFGCDKATALATRYCVLLHAATRLRFHASASIPIR